MKKTMCILLLVAATNMYAMYSGSDTDSQQSKKTERPLQVGEIVIEMPPYSADDMSTIDSSNSDIKMRKLHQISQVGFEQYQEGGITKHRTDSLGQNQISDEEKHSIDRPTFQSQLEDNLQLEKAKTKVLNAYEKAKLANPEQIRAKGLSFSYQKMMLESLQKGLTQAFVENNVLQIGNYKRHLDAELEQQGRQFNQEIAHLKREVRCGYVVTCALLATLFATNIITSMYK